MGVDFLQVWVGIMHTLITGTTGSGKSTLAKMLAKSLQTRGHGIVVLDPMRSNDWGVQPHYEQGAFLEEVKSRKDCFVFVDEAGAMIGRYNVEMEWCATTGRHFGHKSTFICQYVTQLAPVVRSNCDKVYLFATDGQSREKLAQEFDQPSIEKVKLKQFQFVILSRFDPPDFRSISIDKGTVVRLESPAV
jgi:energy-coupling factor transporter ATP-binding protein EcfA2